MRYLITGVNGYIGLYLKSEMIKQNVPFIGVGHKEFDLNDSEMMLQCLIKNNITHVIHLAGAVENASSEVLFDSNIAGLYRLLYECSKVNIKHVTFASSNVVYSSLNTSQTVTNGCEPDINNLYAISKYAGDLLLADFCIKHNIKYANVRIADVYGPKQKYGNLVKSIVSNVVNNRPLIQYGNGERKRDFIYITDVAKGLAFISQREITGTVNLGTGIGTSVSELLEIAYELSEGKSQIQKFEVLNEDCSKIWLDVTPLREEGFSPEISLKEGLRKCMMEMRHNGTA